MTGRGNPTAKCGSTPVAGRPRVSGAAGTDIHIISVVQTCGPMGSGIFHGGPRPHPARGSGRTGYRTGRGRRGPSQSFPVSFDGRRHRPGYRGRRSSRRPCSPRDAQSVGRGRGHAGTAATVDCFAHKGQTGSPAVTPQSWKEAAMARDHSRSATLSPEELAAAERAGRKRLGEDGCPEERQQPGTPPADREPDDTVPENERPDFIDSMRGM